jgi:hypothetical protein
VRGRWIVRVLEENRAAVAFWADVIRSYATTAVAERGLTAGARRWRVFTFHSR